MGGSPTQELAQNVCQKYGWSARFEADTVGDCGFWVCYITVGWHDTRRFVSTCPATASRKEGVAAASLAALVGLRDEIASQEAKPLKQLTDVFPLYVDKNDDNDKRDNKTNHKNHRQQQPRFAIVGSSQRNWDDYIWSKKPAVVGIDTEGNQVAPPVLVQIATDECVILEIPSINGGRISDNLRRLLQDDSIVKVFCDNYSHHDKKSLGISVTAKVDQNEELLFSKGSILDLEVLASQVLGPVQVARGLSRIVTLVMPELNVSIGKPKRLKDIGRFAMIEQGKAPPLTRLRDLSKQTQYYAALDAWVTLQAYRRIQNTDIE